MLRWRLRSGSRRFGQRQSLWLSRPREHQGYRERIQRHGEIIRGLYDMRKGVAVAAPFLSGNGADGRCLLCFFADFRHIEIRTQAETLFVRAAETFNKRIYLVFRD